MYQFASVTTATTGFGKHVRWARVLPLLHVLLRTATGLDFVLLKVSSSLAFDLHSFNSSNMLDDWIDEAAESAGGPDVPPPLYVEEIPIEAAGRRNDGRRGMRHNSLTVAKMKSASAGNRIERLEKTDASNGVPVHPHVQ